MRAHVMQKPSAVGWLLCLLLAASCSTHCQRLAAAEPASEPALGEVRLVVDYGDGAQLHLTGLAWRQGMTVIDALVAAQKHPHGVKFEQRGRGATAMITAIGNLKNEGSGKNWLYSVNGKTAEVGAGAYELNGGDRILWEFKAYE